MKWIGEGPFYESEGGTYVILHTIDLWGTTETFILYARELKVVGRPVFELGKFTSLEMAKEHAEKY